MLKKNSKIFLAGHRGLVGTEILYYLNKYGYKNVYVMPRIQLNLLEQNKVFNYFKKNLFDGVIIAAAKVGGINANNTERAEFIYENTQIQNNIIHSAYKNKVKNLIFLGSSCIYPKNCLQPIKEEYLLTSKLEYTNEPYAIAKINGLKLCENYSKQYNLNYKCLMPTNVFGDNDNYDLATSHFLPAIIKKISDAIILDKKYILLWGNGMSKRELIFSGDLARACVFFLGKKTKENLINIGSGYEKTIFQYTNFLIKNFCPGLKIKYIKKNLNGTPRKILNSNIAKKYKWKPIFNLEKELKRVFLNFHKKNIINYKL
jgi:GDP-L-fucose synthase